MRGNEIRSGKGKVREERRMWDKKGGVEDGIKKSHTFEFCQLQSSEYRIFTNGQDMALSVNFSMGRPPS